MSYDALSFTLVGASESRVFNLEEGGDVVAEAEVKVTVASDEEQTEALAATDTADTTTETIDQAAEMFLSLTNVYNLSNVVAKSGISASLYAFANNGGQLDKMLGQSVAAESLGTGNTEIGTKINGKLLAAAASADKSVQGAFGLIGANMAAQEVAMAAVTKTRIANMAKLIAKLEADAEETDVEVEVKEPAEDGTPVETTAEVVEPTDGGETPDPTEPAATEPETEEGANTSPVTVEIETSADVATPEETEEAVEALKLGSLKTTPIVSSLSAASEGSSEDIQKVQQFNKTVLKASHKLRANKAKKRTFKTSKLEILNACKSYMAALEQSAVLGMLFYGAKGISEAGKSTTVASYESFVASSALFLSACELSRYVNMSKKVMDSSYYNLKFLASKIIAAKARKNASK